MVGVNRKISAATARAHNRKCTQIASFKLPPGLYMKILAVLLVGILAWIYQVIQPPPPKTCRSPDGPPVTAPRIRLKNGRHLAYEEHGVPRDVAKNKVIYVHGFNSGRLNAVVATNLSPTRFVESDLNPQRMVESKALDIEELADQLELGSKSYVIGYSKGGQMIWSCLKYSPNRYSWLS